MKKIILLVIAVTFGLTAHAQWQTSGSDIYYTSGKVGIGVSSPSAKLHVKASGNIIAYFQQQLTSGEDAGIKIRGSRSGCINCDIAFIDLMNWDNDESGGTEYITARIAGGQANSHGLNGYLKFYTGNSGTLYERMRIDKNGRVGIGTTSPTELLELYSPTVTHLLITGQQAKTLFKTDNEDITLVTGSYYSGVATSYKFLGSNLAGSAIVNSLGDDLQRMLIGTKSQVPVILGTDDTERVRITPDGNVGIGTANPNYPLTVSHDEGITSGIHHLAFFSRLANGTGNTGLSVDYEADGSATTRTLVYFPGQRDVTFQTNDGGRLDVLHLTQDGKVGIGTSSPDAELAVNGTISTKEVNVTTTGFPDYVFQPDYKLLSLQELKSFIENEGHLPEIPTAQDVQESGVNLGEMNRKLVQKIEELTLYVIQLQEEIDKLKKE